MSAPASTSGTTSGTSTGRRQLKEEMSDSDTGELSDGMKKVCQKERLGVGQGRNGVTIQTSLKRQIKSESTQVYEELGADMYVSIQVCKK